MTILCQSTTCAIQYPNKEDVSGTTITYKVTIEWTTDWIFLYSDSPFHIIYSDLQVMTDAIIGCKGAQNKSQE